MGKTEFLQLIDKYLAGNASVEEEQLLLNFFNSFQAQAEWDESVLGVKQQLEDKMLQRIQAAIRAGRNETKVVKAYPLRKIAAVLTGAAILAAGAFYFSHKPAPQNIVTATVVAPVKKQDADPGGNNAILTLGDGSKVVLSKAKDGVLAKSGNVSIKKTKDGEIIYLAEGNKNGDANAPVTYNTISTPIGGQYQVVLPDGSKIWLNAASSLKYPTAFKGDQRAVELNGEGYFEIAQNVAMPFIVKVNDAEVKVLGTHFNIMAYNNEPALRTTLLEGSVILSNAGNNNKLKPGEQGVINKDGRIRVQTVDVDHVIAWKNGYFDFNRSTTREIMNQLARWYDMEVTYSGNIPEDEFVGKISRSAKLSEVLHILHLSHVQFKIEDKKIIVTP